LKISRPVQERRPRNNKELILKKGGILDFKLFSCRVSKAGTKLSKVQEMDDPQKTSLLKARAISCPKKCSCKLARRRVMPTWAWSHICDNLPLLTFDKAIQSSLTI
jgi:hypothetical protein